MTRATPSAGRGAGAGRRLPIVRIDGRLYYMDVRLREFRAVEDFMRRIAFAEKPRYELIES